MTVVALALLCAVQAACLVWFVVAAHTRLVALIDKLAVAQPQPPFPTMVDENLPDPPEENRVAVALRPDGTPEPDLNGEKPKNMSARTWALLQEERMARMFLNKLDNMHPVSSTDTVPVVGDQGEV